MAVSMNFRSAFNGFNREDVVHYIEYISAKHTAEVNQLNSEIEYLKGKQPTSTEDETATLQARITELEERCAELEASQAANTHVQELEDRCAQLEAQLKQAQEEKVQAETVAAQQAPTQQYSMEQELEAYRRAERTERLAQERAELIEQIANENAQRTEQLAKEYAEDICKQTNSALADATVKVDTAAAEISAMVENAMEQLSQLQTVIAGSKQTLTDAAASMYAIRPADHE